jgi:hypothetical protein
VLKFQIGLHQISLTLSCLKGFNFQLPTFETAQFQNGFLACRSPAKIDLCLKLLSPGKGYEEERKVRFFRKKVRKGKEKRLGG